MKINIAEFIKIIKKLTVNYTNDYCQFVISQNSIKGSILNDSGNVISKINIKNDLIDIVENEVEFNIFNSETTIIPYLQLFESETVDLKIEILRHNLVKNLILNDKISKVKTKLNLCEPLVKRYFAKEGLSNQLSFACDFILTENFIDCYNKIKKIAQKNDKIYIVSEQNQLFLESGDRSTPHINSAKIEIDNKANEDFVLCFIFQNFSALLSILEFTNKTYSLKIMCKKEKDMGILYISDEDKTEEFYITSFKQI